MCQFNTCDIPKCIDYIEGVAGTFHALIEKGCLVQDLTKLAVSNRCFTKEFCQTHSILPERHPQLLATHSFDLIIAHSDLNHCNASQAAKRSLVNKGTEQDSTSG